MASPRDSPSSASTTVPRNIEEELENFHSQVLLMILSYVNGSFQNHDTPPQSLLELLINLERDRSDSYSGIINYTFKRLIVDSALFFTPDRDTVELLRDQELAAGIELRLALVDFLLTLRDQQTASRAIKKIAKELGSLVQVLQMTPLEIIGEVCNTNRRSFEDVLSISTSVAKEFNHEGFFDHLRDTDWLHNRDDVNRFLLRRESSFSKESGSYLEMALFMTQTLATSDYTTMSIKGKLCGICQNPWKGAVLCILVSIGLLILLLVGVGISIKISHHSPNPVNQSMEIGDIRSSSALIPVPNNVSSVSLDISFEVTVFMASSIPPTEIRILQSRIFQSYGPCVPYNVNNGNHPVYLLPGSIMNYDMTVSGLSDSKCPIQIVLLNNKTEYLACNYNSSNVVKAYCLTNGTMNISIMINESANYYVILVKEDLTVSVSSADITVHQVYYNTSHLSPAKDCDHRSNDASSCTVHNPDIKKWSCSNTEWYVILQSSTNEDVGYKYKTPSFSPSYDYCLLTKWLIGTSVTVSSILLVVLIGCCLWTLRNKKFKRIGSKRNESIQNNLPLHTGYARIP